ncbi:D-hexose-6-phosphate mutarotase [Pirellulaceae bacterium SH449]
MTITIDELNEIYGLEDCLVFESHSNGLPLGRVTTPHCSAAFLLYGAHVLSYQPASEKESILFLSDQAVYEKGKPIRGGIPICFPWFGAHPDKATLPAHGWARTQDWELLETAQSHENIVVRLRLISGGYEVICELGFGSQFSIDLDVRNQGSEPLTYEVALHTYFKVADVERVQIVGLEGVPFIDQLTNSVVPGQSHAIRFTEETDRIYQGDAGQIQMHDDVLRRTIELAARGARSTIVWNPWVAKSQRMADFGDEEFHEMCCIETANVRANCVQLAPGESQRTGVSIKTKRMDL